MAAMRKVGRVRGMRWTTAVAAVLITTALSGCAAPASGTTSAATYQALPAQRLLGVLTHSPTPEQNLVSAYVYAQVPNSAPIWRSETRTLEIWIDPDTPDDAVGNAIYNSGIIGGEWSSDMGAVEVHRRQFNLAQVAAAVTDLHSDPAIQSRHDRIESVQVRYDGTIVVRLDGPIDWAAERVDWNNNPLLTFVDGIPVFAESAGLTGLLPFHTVRLS